MAEDAREENGNGEGDAMRRLRKNSDRYGKTYAVFGEAFRDAGFTKLVRLVWWFILGMAALAVAMAILSKF